jgi:steroid delta-isomerase-like uncharacterized protein
MSRSPTDTVRRFYETVFQPGAIDTASQFIADDFVDHAPWPGQPPTRAGFEAGTLDMYKAFPDLAIEPVKLIEEEGKVAAVVRISGTQHGEFMGHAGSGRAFEIDAVDILRIDNGKLAEHWGVIDVGQMLAQLRLSPAA